jgi:hypothetical protein
MNMSQTYSLFTRSAKNLMFSWHTGPRPLGEKPDVLLAHRPKVEHLTWWLSIKTFYEKLQDIAGIVDRLKPMIRILPRPIRRSSEKGQ